MRNYILLILTVSIFSIIKLSYEATSTSHKHPSTFCEEEDDDEDKFIKKPESDDSDSTLIHEPSNEEFVSEMLAKRPILPYNEKRLDHILMNFDRVSLGNLDDVMDGLKELCSSIWLLDFFHPIDSTDLEKVLVGDFLEGDSSTPGEKLLMLTVIELLDYFLNGYDYLDVIECGQRYVKARVPLGKKTLLESSFSSWEKIDYEQMPLVKQYKTDAREHYLHLLDWISRKAYSSQFKIRFVLLEYMLNSLVSGDLRDQWFEIMAPCMHNAERFKDRLVPLLIRVHKLVIFCDCHFDWLGFNEKDQMLFSDEDIQRFGPPLKMAMKDIIKMIIKTDDHDGHDFDYRHKLIFEWIEVFEALFYDFYKFHPTKQENGQSFSEDEDALRKLRMVPIEIAANYARFLREIHPNGKIQQYYYNERANGPDLFRHLILSTLSLHKAVMKYKESTVEKQMQHLGFEVDLWNPIVILQTLIKVSSPSYGLTISNCAPTVDTFYSFYLKIWDLRHELGYDHGDLHLESLSERVQYIFFNYWMDHFHHAIYSYDENYEYPTIRKVSLSDMKKFDVEKWKNMIYDFIDLYEKLRWQKQLHEKFAKLFFQISQEKL